METLLPFIFGGFLLLTVRWGDMSDKKKIDIILSRIKISVREEETIKTCRYIRKNKIKDGMEYIYRMPLGIAFTKIQENIQVFKDGLHKNLEIEFKSGMVHFLVYDTDLPKEWSYESESGENV
jgi:DNA segregation ATPase FtsK/SpoIIIE, S-DNA-T family